MKPQLPLAAFALLLSTLNFQLSTCLAQGSLTPPGAPASTMKTLAQIEPRTPIATAPFTISQPGSYYLTTNLTVSSGDAITIAANNVTLDLNGFTIASTAASATGIAILLSGGRTNIAIYNGHISSGVTNNGSGTYGGSGFNTGIYFSTAIPCNVRVKDVSVTGVLNYGIYLALNSTVVAACTVNVAGSYGIVASSVADSTANDCGLIAINATTAQNCAGSSSSGTGLSAITALNCSGKSTSSYGLTANTAQNCYGNSSSGYGLLVTTAQNCSGFSSSSYGLAGTTGLHSYGSSSGSYGIYITAAEHCYGYSGSGPGLYAITAQNCYGRSDGNNSGISATYANSCYGQSNTGVGLSATYANFCFGSSVSVSAFKYNMP